MDKTSIDLFDSIWNPVTYCYHGCEYCYFCGDVKNSINTRISKRIKE